MCQLVIVPDICAACFACSIYGFKLSPAALLLPFSYTEYIALPNLCIFRAYAIAGYSVFSITDSHLSTNLC